MARNPVVNNATKNMVCDNPDSMYALNGLDFLHYSWVTQELLESFGEISQQCLCPFLKANIFQIHPLFGVQEGDRFFEDESYDNHSDCSQLLFHCQSLIYWSFEEMVS